VRAAAASQLTPLSDPIGFPLLRVELDPSATPIVREVRTQFVTPGWLQTYGTPLRAGRDLTDHDNAEASPVVLVNETFERLAFGPGRAVGQRVSQPTKDAPMPRVIVGVVADTVVQGLRDSPQPTMYVPLSQFRFPYGLAGISISVRTASGSPLGLVPAIAAAIARVDRQLTFSVRPLVDQIAAARSQERLVALLSSFFGGFVLVLAAVGVYGLLTNSVAQRTRELAIRMALGAQRRQVVAIVLRRTAILTTVGIGLGLVTALMATRLVEGLLFDVKPRDPLTLFAASLLFAVVAGVASFVPARRATHTDPLVALRSD
jgi:ABC-type lipoprotein release transport system permease subunit